MSEVNTVVVFIIENLFSLLKALQMTGVITLKCWFSWYVMNIYSTVKIPLFSTFTSAAAAVTKMKKIYVYCEHINLFLVPTKMHFWSSSFKRDDHSPTKWKTVDNERSESTFHRCLMLLLWRWFLYWQFIWLYGSMSKYTWTKKDAQVFTFVQMYTSFCSSLLAVFHFPTLYTEDQRALVVYYITRLYKHLLNYTLFSSCLVFTAFGESAFYLIKSAIKRELESGESREMQKGRNKQLEHISVYSSL